MSYVALATDRFDEVVHFYRELLQLPVADAWDRDEARGIRFDAGGMQLEILDNSRQRQPLQLGDAAERLHIVIEVEDIEAARSSYML